MKDEKGSILVLTLISILILSLMVIGLLTVGSTETATTANYQLSRIAYYTAMQGVEDVRAEIIDSADSANAAEDVEEIYRDLSSTEVQTGYGAKTSYMSGSLMQLEDFETSLAKASGGTEVTPPKLREFEGISPPQKVATDLKIATLIPRLIRVQITSKVEMAGRTAYSEIIAGVYYYDVVDDSN